MKDDATVSLNEAKHSKKGVTGHGGHEVCFLCIVIRIFFMFKVLKFVMMNHEVNDTNID